MNNNIYTVGQVNRYIKNMFTEDFMMKRIYVKGEISNCKYHPSGHIYFTLKDETGALQAILFASDRRNLKFPMKNGDKVVALGSITVYERDGKYQLYAREIHLDGYGELYRRFEELRKELAEMGMFAAEYKKPIPKYVRRVGIVTASSGAAIRDIVTVAARRNPYVQLILYPALVQGDGAVASIVRGIHVLEEQNVDVIIVGRGGGSIEDLWAFNEEAVARAIFACEVPVISAVGHETDTTIADYVADLRAPTPSAAAELAVYEIRDLMDCLQSKRTLLDQRLRDQIARNRMRCDNLARALRLLHPLQQARDRQQRVAAQKELLRSLMRQKIEEARQRTNRQERMQELLSQKLLLARHRLALYAQGLEGLSPVKKLSQGYSYVTDPQGRCLTKTDQVKISDTIHLTLLSGELDACVTKIIPKEEHIV